MNARAALLIVDDEPGLREMLAWELSQEGFEIETAESGMAALETCKRRKFDLALTDLKMPGMDGIAIVEALRGRDPDIEVIVATGYATVETAVACMKRGAYDYIQKPYDMTELKLLLERALQKRHLQGVVALYEASRLLLATLKRSDIIRRAIDLAQQVFRANAVGLLLWSQDGGHFETYRLPGAERPCESLLVELAQRSAAAGQPLLLAPASAAGPDLLIPGADGSILAFNLEARGRAVGSLVLLREEGVPRFVSSELQRGTVFAAQVALSLDNACLHEALEERVCEIQAVNHALEARTKELQRTALQQKRAEERLKHLATHDHLTSLPNRVLLHDRLTQAVARARRYQHQVGLLLLDLDRFKEVNDTLGHNVGDCLLQEVSKTLARCVRDCDTVARMGGDEFIIILGDLRDPRDAEKVAERILAELNKNFVIAGREMRVGTSIGISLYPGDGEDIETLLKDADIAMYSAKRHGGSAVRFFSSGMSKSAEEKMAATSALRKALEREQFLLHYQPLIELSSGRIAGVEALLRWQHPEKGLLAPLTFVPMAEDSGLIVPIGEWVLTTACRQNRQWQQAGFPPVPMAVNVSARQLRQKDFGATVMDALREGGLAPEYLVLEITESTAMQNVDEYARTLVELHQHGVQIFIDDFGSGYSSFNWLKKLPVTALKIDRFFTQHIVDDRNDAAIVMSIVAMARSLDIRVVAEGVETTEQLERLRSLKWTLDGPVQCDQVQGFFFSQPVSAEEFALLLAHDQRQRGSVPGVATICRHPSVVAAAIPDSGTAESRQKRVRAGA